MIYNVGDVNASETIWIPLNTYDSTGASVTVTDLAAGDVKIHKDGGTTQRSSANGITVSIDFDTITGNHLIAIDLSDNTDAGFYAVGSDYQVRVEGITVATKTINCWVGTFSIRNRSALMPTTAGRTLDVESTGEAGLDFNNIKDATGAHTLTNITVPVVTTTTTATTATSVTNTVSADVVSIGGVAQSMTDLKDFADTGYDPATHKVAGVVLADTTTTVTNEVSANVTKISSDANAADNLELFFDGTGYNAANSTVGNVTLTATTTAVTNEVTADVTKISGDATAANNAELFFDGTGYNAANSTVGTVTSVTTTTSVTNEVSANLTKIGGVAQSMTDLKDFVDDGYNPVTHKVAGVVLTDTCTTNSDMRGTDGALLAANVNVASGVIEANVLQLGGVVQSATDLKDFADDGYDPSTNKVAGVVLTDTCTTTTTTTSVTNEVSANLTKVGGVAQSMTDLKDFIDTGYDPVTHKVQGVVLTDGCTLTTTTTTITNEVSANITKIGGVAQSMTDLKDLVDTGYDPSTHKIQGVVLTDTCTTNTDMRGTNSALLASSYVAPDNTTITNIKTDTGNLITNVGALNDFDPSTDVVAHVTLVDTTTAITNEVSVDVTKISGDSVAADNLEKWFDNTGYTASNSTIGTCTTNSDMRGTNNALLATSYTAPDNTTITNIKTDTGNLITSVGALNDVSTSDVEGACDAAITANTDINNIDTGVNTIESAVTTLQTDITFIKDIEGGKWKITGNQMIFYKSDNATEVARFNLFKNDVASQDEPDERRRA